MHKIAIGKLGHKLINFLCVMRVSLCE